MGFFDSLKHAVTGESTPGSVPVPSVRPRITAPPSEPGARLSDAQLAALPPALRQAYSNAGIAMSKGGLLGERAAVYSVVDYSASMSSMWNDGTMGGFLTKALALSAHFDDDGTVPVFAFGSSVIGPLDIDLADAEQAAAMVVKNSGGFQNRTLYAPAIKAVVRQHLAEAQAKAKHDNAPPAPGYVIFQTDGDAHDPAETRKALVEASQYPIFFQFVGFGGHSEASFGLLNDLDTMEGRLVDNAGFFWAGSDPRSLSDADMFDGLMNEFPEYLEKARAVFSN